MVADGGRWPRQAAAAGCGRRRQVVVVVVGRCVVIRGMHGCVEWLISFILYTILYLSYFYVFALNILNNDIDNIMLLIL